MPSEKNRPHVFSWPGNVSYRYGQLLARARSGRNPRFQMGGARQKGLRSAEQTALGQSGKEVAVATSSPICTAGNIIRRWRMVSSKSEPLEPLAISGHA